MLKKTRVMCVGVALAFSPMAVLGSSTNWSLASGGSYSWNGSSSSGLVGQNIPSLTLLGAGTPLHNGTSVSIVDGYLNFVSGAYNGNGSNWSWGAGSPGTLTLTGCIAGVTAAVCTGSNDVTLVSDDFQSVQIVPLLGSLDAVFGNITGTINSSVANYFGISNAFSTASFTTAISTSGTQGHALTGTNLLGVINANPPSVAAAEEWGIGESLGFLAFVLITFALMIRFKVIQPLRQKFQEKHH